MGLGDLVFYSMLSGSILFEFQPNLLPCLVFSHRHHSWLFPDAYNVRDEGIFPGLPFPVILGLAGGILAALVA